MKIDNDSNFCRAILDSFKEQYFTWHSFLTIISSFILLPDDILVMISFSFIGVIDPDKIDIEHFNKYLLLMDVSNTNYYEELFLKYKEYFFYFINRENKNFLLFQRFIDLLEDIPEVYNPIIKFRHQLIRATIDQYWIIIKERLLRIDQITDFINSNNGELPPETCCQLLSRTISNQPHPCLFDFYCKDMESHDKKLSQLITQLQTRFSSLGVPFNPNIYRLKKIGSSYSNGVSRGGLVQYPSSKITSINKVYPLPNQVPTETSSLSSNIEIR